MDTSFAKPKTSYRHLFAFQKAEAIYDLTYLFLERNISKNDRTNDQMLQAARSGKQNLVEGRSDSGASAEIEIKLYGVAYGSLHELLNDFLDFMRTRKIPIWDIHHPRSAKLRQICKTHNDTQYYMSFAERLNNEELTNLAITLIYQTLSMISKLTELVKSDFLINGGIKEQMYRARINHRNIQGNHEA